MRRLGSLGAEIGAYTGTPEGGYLNPLQTGPGRPRPVIMKLRGGHQIIHAIGSCR